MPDSINHPSHYTQHPSGVEVIEITEHMGFNLGNVVKYVLRSGLKGDMVEDLKKAAWYLDREIQRLTKERDKDSVKVPQAFWVEAMRSDNA